MRDLAGRPVNEHLLAQPLTGALWDTSVDMFHESLVARKLISRSVEELADEVEYNDDLETDPARFDAAYADDPEGFKRALSKHGIRWAAPGGHVASPGSTAPLLSRSRSSAPRDRRELNRGRFARSSPETSPCETSASIPKPSMCASGRATTPRPGFFAPKCRRRFLASAIANAKPSHGTSNATREGNRCPNICSTYPQSCSTDAASRTLRFNTDARTFFRSQMTCRARHRG